MTTVIDGTSGITFPAGGTGNPAGTVVGTTDTQTLTNKTIDGSQLVAASVTSTQMATAVQPLGVGQTMTDVAGSRTSGTTYTNSTGRPITVYISAADSTNTMYAQVNSVVVYQSLSRSTYFNYLPICFIVPSGSTYVVANITYLASWVELR